MKNISELKKIAKKDKKLQRKRDKLGKKQDKLYSRISKIAYKLYQIFIDKNWDSLNRDEIYYYLYLEFDDDIFIMEELNYVDTDQKLQQSVG